MVQYSTTMIFAVLDVSLIMGLNIGKTDSFFYINFTQWGEAPANDNATKFGAGVDIQDLITHAKF